MTAVRDELWLPTVVGGRLHGSGRRLLVAVTVLFAVGVMAIGGMVLAVYRIADSNIQREEIGVDVRDDDQPLNVLVVGSDSREGLSPEQIDALNLGNFAGERGDTMFLVSITRGSSQARVVSLPRDLRVIDGDRERKLTETFSEGPSHVVDVLRANFGIPIHHYVEISIPGFISVVDAVGGVQLCLDEPLKDRKSGADFEAGCHLMGPADALAYVRARNTARGDFDRIDRQQRFMRALIDRLVSTRTLIDPRRLFSITEQVSRNVTTDQGLKVRQMQSLAFELRELARGNIPMMTVPAYTQTIGRKSFVVPYGPGAAALFAAIAAGEPIPDRGARPDREEVDVEVWAAGDPTHADLIQRTLFWSAFNSSVAGDGPLPTPPVTVVYALPGQELAAGWVAAMLGVAVEPLPAGTTAPEGIEVVVLTGPHPS